MKKIIILGLSVVIIALVAFFNNSRMDTHNRDIRLLTLENIEALADREATKDCPGGTCSFTYSTGAICNACCPYGKQPKCDMWGCTCT